MKRELVHNICVELCGITRYTCSAQKYRLMMCSRNPTSYMYAMSELGVGRCADTLATAHMS